ncbi:hypothetical protein Val02_00510 [Virgisporangium aliadipatigenens]|uniref:Uncharacterized protein n=1 Tax=Virgisporangium aliadipatigenens TaxID=741659 RepID=A0A8J4DLX0_9ACTN|nr:hypothetical protein [Virgisporangium aliadipatigenens]GIJ43165.1 hypothetical protein Val02_00510 [Virgisporangium aliadipatigenens]
MRKWLSGAVAALVGVGLATLPAGPAAAEASHAQLALRWAPIHYQDVDQTGGHALGGRSDYVTRVDFDGNWTGRDNWEGAARVAAAAYAPSVYYSVVETSTHWYVTYLFFHPRDWTDHPFFETEHENDAEGVLLAVERDGSTYGALRAAVTVAHSDFYSYTPAGSTWTSGRESVDGTLQLQTNPRDGLSHPVTAQEAKGHGLKAFPQYNIQGDGLIYYPATSAEPPANADDRDVPYTLVDIFASGGLWSRRNDTALFAGWGSFAGDDDTSTGSDACGVGTYDCGTDSANAPWGWDDGNDVPGRGELATNPARLAAEYFTIPGNLSRTYTSNRYAA